MSLTFTFPTFQYAFDDINNASTKSIKSKKLKGMDNVGFVVAAEELGMIERLRHNNNNNYKATIEDGPGKKMTLNKPLEVIISNLLFIVPYV